MKEPNPFRWYKRGLMVVAAFFGYGCLTHFGNDAAGAFMCYNGALFLLWTTTFADDKKPEPPEPRYF